MKGGKSFAALLSKIVQTKAQTLIWIHSFVFLSIPFNQLPNKLVTFVGRGGWRYTESKMHYSPNKAGKMTRDE
jgi:hypothetical protein